ncbi:MAG: paraquat-inducible protein A [Geodermatophilaceae bacterium]|nr:paraquat-inducible protein A [Geodermatophilaceae bacterium]
MALSVPPLMAVGLTASFLSLGGGSIGNSASVIEAAGAVAAPGTWPLALIVGAFIMGLPVCRAVALAYVLVPLHLGRPPAAHAAAAFRLAIALRPWSMAEIFLIGVAVAMVKLTGLASVSLGPAFWSFAMLAVIALFEDAILCERSLWDRIG